jgi:hypothetical protein
MFRADEKRHQHYVPQFWQKRFAGPDNIIQGLKRGRIRSVSSKKLMAGDWLYTTFDAHGRPSNAIEDASSVWEGKAADAMRSIDNMANLGSLEVQLYFRWFIAFSACRHPDTMASGHRRSKQLAYVLADAWSKSLPEFQQSLQGFGVPAEEASGMYNMLRSISEEELLDQAEDVETRPPNDPFIPAQLALDPETIERVFFLLAKHTVTILDAPPGQYFILGDTPFPPGLANGFIVPLSSSLALLWENQDSKMFPTWTRRHATAGEVERSNQEQVDNALEVVIGPTCAVLQRYVISPV